MRDLYRQFFSTYRANKSLKLCFTLNCVLERANYLKTISNWFVLLSTCFRNLPHEWKLFPNPSDTQQRYNKYLYYMASSVSGQDEPNHALWLATRASKMELYYMASSASGQDEPNRAMWLATRAGKIEPSCSLGITRCIPQENFPRKPYNRSFIGQVCLVKMGRCWPRSPFASLWTSTSSRSINTQKKEPGQYQAILTSHLVNNHTYLLFLLFYCPRRVLAQRQNPRRHPRIPRAHTYKEKEYLLRM